MMKKLTSALLAVALILSFGACDNKETTSNSELTQSSQLTEEVTTPESTALEFQEKVFVDDENCTFKITGYEIVKDWGYTFKAYVENKTDKVLIFSLRDVSVNGYMCDPFFTSEVQPGKKSQDNITFFESNLEELNIEEINDIEFTLVVYDSENWETPHFVEEKFTLNMNE